MRSSLRRACSRWSLNELHPTRSVASVGRVELCSLRSCTCRGRAPRGDGVAQEEEADHEPGHYAQEDKCKEPANRGEKGVSEPVAGHRLSPPTPWGIPGRVIEQVDPRHMQR